MNQMQKFGENLSRHDMDIAETTSSMYTKARMQLTDILCIIFHVVFFVFKCTPDATG